MKKILLVQILGIIFFASAAKAEIVDMTPYVTLIPKFTKGTKISNDDLKQNTPDFSKVDITIEEEHLGFPLETKGGPGGKYGSKAAGGLDMVNRVVNIADTLWQIMKDGEPITNANLKYATALPGGVDVKSWHDLEFWKGPAYVIYQVKIPNMMGIDAVKFKFMVKYTYGGSYNGRGKYLTGAAIDLVEQRVLWGWNMSMQAEAPASSLLNKGTETNPLAYMILVLKYQIGTPLFHSDASHKFEIWGNGSFKQLER